MGARRGVITSKELRTENNELSFWIDERFYTKDAARRISLETTVDGSIVSDFGFHEGDRLLSLGNIKLSDTKLAVLRDMQEDDDNDYMFSDGVNLWEVTLSTITVAGLGSFSICGINMNVVEKVV